MSETAPKKPVIGLVGGSGSGKSFVASQFASLGCAVIDADRLAHESLKESDVIEQLVSWWGPGILDEGGNPNRKTISEKVFGTDLSQRQNLSQLEELIHPKIGAKRRRLHRQYQQDTSVNAIVEDCPLLIEKQLDEACDCIIFVDVDRDTRLKRLADTRGWTAKELDQREKNQIGVDIKAKRADHVIDNNAGKDQCLDHVRRVLSQILQRDNSG